MSPNQPTAVRRRILWIAVNTLLGAAGGVTLGWGPLASPTPVIVALGGLGALLGGAIGWTAREKLGRRRVLVGHGLIVAIVAVAALIPLYRIGMLRVPGASRTTNFERLWRAMAYAYPYFEVKGVDWDAMREAYAPQVAAATSDAEYWRTVAIMLAELNDGHTGVLSPSAQGGRRYFATCRNIDGAIVLDTVGETAQDAGLVRGDVVLAVNGLPTEAALAALSPLLRIGSTPQQRRAKAALNLLSTTADTLTVKVDSPDGKHTVTLTWPDAATAPDAASTTPTAPLITGERLPDGSGLIRIPTFGAGGRHDLVAEFDAALDTLMTAPGLILDLRGNGGGSTFISDPIAGRFFERAFTYGREHYRARLPQRGWRPHFDYRVKPRGAPYTGPLVLIIDAGVFSTGETFAVALVDSGRAVTVGRQTGGGSGNPVPFTLTGNVADGIRARVRFSTGDFRRIDGTRIEGLGITPDLPVAWTVAAFRAGEDPDLDAAMALLAQLK